MGKITAYLIAMSFSYPWPYRIFQLCLIATMVMFVSALGKRIRLLRGRQKTDLLRNENIPFYRVYAWVQGFLIVGMALCTPTTYKFRIAVDKALQAWGYHDPMVLDVSWIVVVLTIASFFALGFASLAMWLYLMRNATGPRNDSESRIPVTVRRA